MLHFGRPVGKLINVTVKNNALPDGLGKGPQDPAATDKIAEKTTQHQIRITVGKA